MLSQYVGFALIYNHACFFVLGLAGSSLKSIFSFFLMPNLPDK